MLTHLRECWSYSIEFYGDMVYHILLQCFCGTAATQTAIVYKRTNMCGITLSRKGKVTILNLLTFDDSLTELLSVTDMVRTNTGQPRT